jgi:hypothetical protein
MNSSLTLSGSRRDAPILAALVFIGSLLILLAALYVGEELRPAVLIAGILIIIGITLIVPNWSITIAYPLTWIIWGMTIDAIGGRPERAIVALGFLGTTVMLARSGWMKLGMTKLVGWGLGLFISMFVVSLYANPTAPKGAEVILSIVYRVLFFWLVMLHLRTDRDLKIAVLTYIGISFVPSLINLWLGLEFGFGFIRVYETSVLVRATVDRWILDLSSSGNFLTMPAVFMLALLPWMRTVAQRRWLVGGAVFLLAMAFVAQLRREVMITIPVLLAILAVDKASRIQKTASRILLAMIVAFPLVIYPRFQTLQMRFRDENPRITEGTDPRVMNFVAGVSAFMESPIVGTGPGSYAKAVMPHMGWYLPSFMYSPYNVFTWAAVEAGILAVCGLLILLYGVLREGMKWREQADGTCALVLRLTPAVIAQVFIWFSFGAAWELSLPFFLMGMILAAARITKEKLAI